MTRYRDMPQLHWRPPKGTSRRRRRIMAKLLREVSQFAYNPVRELVMKAMMEWTGPIQIFWEPPEKPSPDDADLRMKLNILHDTYRAGEWPEPEKS